MSPRRRSAGGVGSRLAERLPYAIEDRVDPGIATEDEVDAMPSPVRQPAPMLTHDLRERPMPRIDVAFIVGTDGRVSDVSIRQSTDPSFDAVVLEAVSRWTGI